MTRTSLIALFVLFAIALLCSAESSHYYDLVKFIVEGKDAYKILGVTPKTKLKALKKAFRTLSMKHHPDKVGKATDLYLDIVQAFGILSNEEAKAEYDDLRTNGIPFMDQYYNRYMHEWGAPKHDIRYVLLWTFLSANLLKFMYDYWKHWNIVGKIKRHSQAYKVRKNQILKAKYGSNYKKHKDEDVDIPMEIKGAQPPTYQDILAWQMLLIPYYIYKAIEWQCLLDEDGKIEIVCKKNGITREEYDAQMAAYQAQHKKRMHSAKMKRYLKWRKRNGKD